MRSPLYLVVGLGKTGISIARYLYRRGKSFVVFDTRSEPAGLAEFYVEFPGVDVFSAKFPELLYEQLEGIICSPGVSLDEPFLKKAQQLNIPVYGDIECLANEVKVPIIAITGTNGKSTVTTLVGEMLKAAGKTVAVAGNIGLPVLDILDVGVDYELWVLELSSFQLDLTFSLAPIAATILNVSPDHLDRHHTLEAYILAKQRIYHDAKTVLCNRQDESTFPPSTSTPAAKMVTFGLDAPTAGDWGLIEVEDTYYLAHGDKRLLSVNELRIKGRHNWQNALAACALADCVGVAPQYMLEVLKRFSGLPHRSQWVREIEGVEWINDSKGTNVGATTSAISGIGNAMQGKIVLIAGGQGKGADFSALRQPLAEFVRTVILIGQDAHIMDKTFGDIVNVVHAASLEVAVQMAKTHAVPGDVVLLSPACASLDMFRDFNHRGDDFIAEVNSL